jgi:hypothetical protein
MGVQWRLRSGEGRDTGEVATSSAECIGNWMRKARGKMLGDGIGEESQRDSIVRAHLSQKARKVERPSEVRVNPHDHLVRDVT